MTVAPRTRKATKSRKGTNGRKRWSQAVTTGSSALDLQKGVFTLKDPRKIALSLKRSAEQSTRRKSDPYRSAMSMLVFFINRAGKGLDRRQKAVLEKAKDELRALFKRGPTTHERT